MAAPRFGIGFRTAYAHEIADAPGLDWLELVSDHFLFAGGPRRALLERLCARHPLALHGVGLDIAGSDPLDPAYLDALRALVRRVGPRFVSDHLCWTSRRGEASHDLLPVAYTEPVLRHVAERVARVQDRLGQPLLLENATAYLRFRADEMDAAGFLAELCRRSGCGVLLDVNNLYVDARNLGADPLAMLAALPADAVGYLHLAGHAELPDVRIDTHAADVPDPVWRLYAAAVRRFPDAGVILERDDALPPLAELVDELALARARHAAALARHAPASRREVIEVRVGGPPGPGADWPALQRGFWSRVYAESPEAPAADLLFDDTRPVPAARGARVYREARETGLAAALATNFPALARVLGARDWQRLTAAYLCAHPPRGHGFVGLGAALADFVPGHVFEDDYGVDVGALADLARLEQAQLEAQDAPDAGLGLAPAALAAVAAEHWEFARVVFAPCLRLVETRHDVAPVVRAVEAGEAPRRPRAQAMHYRVARGESGVVTEAIGALEAALLAALLAGRGFGEACRAAAQASGAAVAEAAECGAALLVRAASCGQLVELRRAADRRAEAAA